MARQHYENFPVASWLLPAASRPHIAAIYAFARTADDLADEGALAADRRLALLDSWRAQLHGAVQGRTPADPASDDGLILRALAETIRTCRLDVGLFDDLLSAFRQDVTTHRYESWDDVLDYCRRSANPIGRLVLRVAGHRETVLDAHADAICTALQLTNFWQDLARDWTMGRLYVPLSLVRCAGADESDLGRGQISAAWRRVLLDVSGRTRAFFAAGRPLARLVGGRLGWELRATWAGGVRVLDRLEAVGFDVFRARPMLGWGDVVPIGRTMLRGF
ncbi:MAG: squalene synthase HpnC [Acidobacteria bacterium]|nr:squalene synthase HpnC [Acidobacteriota bacterium]